jgi:hypothetical protein
LEISILGPIPVLPGQVFAAISCSIHFALQKHKLPKAGFCQIAFRGFHFVFSFQPKTEGKFDLTKPAIENGFRAMPMPLGNQNFGKVFGAYR